MSIDTEIWVGELVNLDIQSILQLDFSKCDSIELKYLFDRIGYHFTHVEPFDPLVHLKPLKKLIRAMRTHVAAQLNVGDRVQFIRKKTGEVMLGEVFRVNQMTISVACDDGRTCKISAVLLRKVLH